MWCGIVDGRVSDPYLFENDIIFSLVTPFPDLEEPDIRHRGAPPHYKFALI